MKNVIFLVSLLFASCTELKSTECQAVPQAAELTQEDFNLIFPGGQEYTITPIGGGLSGAKIYKVDVGGKEYVVRRSVGVLGHDEIAQEFAAQE